MLLFRPVGLNELRLIVNTEFRAFPPRLPEQPIFYPVLNVEYARQIARDWNTKDEPYAGFVTRFGIGDSYAKRFEVQTVGARMHQELWVPAEELDEFNANMIGPIEVIEYFGSLRRVASRCMVYSKIYRHRRLDVGVTSPSCFPQPPPPTGPPWRLNVRPDNAAAIALYGKCGMREAYRAYTLRVPSSIPLVPASGVALAPLTAEDDAALEARFELQRGQLAYARARASRRLVKLVRDGKVAGIGVFVASVPGSFPFRLTDPALAATFLAHLRPLAAPDATFVQVVVEDNPPLRDAVLALGGYVHIEIAHMHGAL